jgi:hypothetical protein
LQKFCKLDSDSIATGVQIIKAKVHLYIFLAINLINLFGVLYFFPGESNPFLKTIKKMNDLDFKKQNEMRKEFAKFYTSKYKNKKFPIQKFNYFTIFKGIVNIVPSNLGITFPGYLATTIDQREMLPLKNLIQGEEATVLDIYIQSSDDFSLYADKIIIKVSYQDDVLNITLPTFDSLFLISDTKIEPSLSSNYPKNFKFCDQKLQNKKTYTILDMQANLQRLKEMNMYLKDIGDLYKDSNEKYCFDTKVNNLESELSIVMNQAFIFQARVDNHE